jgi:CheY-like chemotaxis protein
MSISPAGSILVVEDEALLRMMAIDMFEDAGFTVFGAENGEDGARLLAENASIEGLFTDIEMPGPISGLDLARIAHDSYPHIGILVVSGRAMPLDGDLPPGARFVGKPYDTQAIVTLFAERTLSGPRPSDGPRQPIISPKAAASTQGPLSDG